MALDLTLNPMQVDSYRFLARTPRSMLFAPMGSGKTVSCLTAIDLVKLLDITRALPLVLAPVRVAKKTWPDECKKWTLHADKEVCYMRTAKDYYPGADLYTSNYERLPQLVAAFGANWPFSTIIADECTRLKGFRLNQGGQRAKALARVAHSLCDRWIGLTGTPASNGLIDLWGMMWFVDKGLRLGRTYTTFIEHFFMPKFSGHGYDLKPFADVQIRNLIRDVCLTVDPRDYGIDIEQPIEIPVEVELPPAARKVYDEMESDMYAEVEHAGAALSALQAGAATMKCMQIANGVAYGQDGRYVTVHKEKLEALDQIIEEAGGASVLVGYAFVPDKDMILAHFGDRAVDISKPNGEAAFRDGSAQIGVAHPASMGHGVDGLQLVCNTLVRYSRNWNSEEDQQLLGRIGPMRQKQAGLDRPVYAYNIVAKRTVDDLIVARHVGKRGVTELLMEACKRRSE